MFPHKNFKIILKSLKIFSNWHYLKVKNKIYAFLNVFFLDKELNLICLHTIEVKLPVS